MFACDHLYRICIDTFSIVTQLNIVTYQAATTNVRTEISTFDYANNLRQCVFNNLIKPLIRMWCEFCIFLFHHHITLTQFDHLNTQPMCKRVMCCTHLISIFVILRDKPSAIVQLQMNKIDDGQCVMLSSLKLFIAIRCNLS